MTGQDNGLHYTNVLIIIIIIIIIGQTVLQTVAQK